MACRIFVTIVALAGLLPFQSAHAQSRQEILKPLDQVNIRLMGGDISALDDVNALPGADAVPALLMFFRQHFRVWERRRPAQGHRLEGLKEGGGVQLGGLAQDEAAIPGEVPGPGRVMGGQSTRGIRGIENLPILPRSQGEIAATLTSIALMISGLRA